jgi:predicted ArsR family transcriptional regulator
MKSRELSERLDDVAILAEPIRRALYEYVARSGRDEAAKATRIERPLAAFHLDKLVDAGFLETAFKRLSDRTGPGAGRTSKLYRRSAKRIELSVPPRRYEALAAILARAVSTSGSAATARAVAEAARDLGRELGAEARRDAGPRPTEERLRRAMERTLERYGFEPRREPGGEIRLGNCPFDAVAVEYRDLVCGLNLEIMSAFLEGLGARGVRAAADRVPGRCCVALRTKSS